MPQCTICTHPQVKEINQAIIEGEILRTIAQRYGVSHYAIGRHKADHIPMKMTAAKLAVEAVEADSLLEQVKDLQKKALDLLAKAEEAGDLKTALQGVREARGCLELLAKLEGQLQQEGTVNIVFAPKWIELRGVIMQVLDSYPEVKIKLAEALSEAEHAIQ